MSEGTRKKLRRSSFGIDQIAEAPMMVPQQSSAEIDGKSHEDRPILLTKKDGLMLANFIIEGKKKYSEVVVWDR
eukprot:scaffold16373_cov105-Cylindrotheca_fusiformis.AAC.1